MVFCFGGNYGKRATAYSNVCLHCAFDESGYHSVQRDSDQFKQHKLDIQQRRQCNRSSYSTVVWNQWACFCSGYSNQRLRKRQ